MTKKLLKSFLLFLLFFVGMTASAYNLEVDGIYYNLNEDGQTVSVTHGDWCYTGDVNIPESIKYNGITYSVTTIGYGAFSECSDLTSVTIPSSVTTIGEAAFGWCENLTSVTIPNSVTTIGISAFNFCTNLKEVIIPNSITSIGSSAFWYCKGLTSVNIPSSVTNIGFYAFAGCGGLTSITVESGNTVYDSREGCNAIIETKSNTLMAGCQNTIIPNSITTIGEYAFSWCSGLTSVTIPNSVITIGKFAFLWCSDLISVNIPNSVKTIEEQAFISCGSLTSVTIGSNVTTIGGCAFWYCSSLKSVISLNPTPPSADYAFDSETIQSATLYVPTGRKSVYEQAFGWKDFLNIHDGIPSAIEATTMDREEKHNAVYTLDGTKVNSADRSALPAGIYIIDGRKHMVK